jgi:hypothetical protein
VTARINHEKHQTDMKSNEQWINETLESLEGIMPSPGDPLLYEKVRSRISNTPQETIFFSQGLIWKIAAGIALLISINIFSIIHNNRSREVSQSQNNSLANEYFSYIETIKF